MINRRQLLKYAGSTLALGSQTLQAQDSALIRKTIPGTTESLPAIGIGTNRYVVGNASANAQLAQTLKLFYQLGGRLIDTAPMYRSSETILGNLIEELKLQGQFFLATKSDAERDQGGYERVENSFRQLRTQTIDLIQIHNLRGLDMLPQLRELQMIDRIRYIGITTSRTQQFPDFLQVMQVEKLDFIQVNYSLADRLAAKRILPMARDKGIAVLINLPLGRGELFSKVQGQSLPDWAADFDAGSWAQFFLKYVISHPAVTCAIPGMRKLNHVEDNLGAATGSLPDAAQRARMESWFDSLG